MLHSSYRGLPSVDRLLREPPVAALLEHYGRAPVTSLVRQLLQDARDAIADGAEPSQVDDLAYRIAARARVEWSEAPQRVINATGVILHTNLGRAPLSSAALDAMRNASAYSDLEFSLYSGERDLRQTRLRGLLQTLTGAESAHVTSNAAGSVLLLLAALARGKEVIVSRGQAVEIGGGFRIPSVLRQSGARLVEVGTTNRTRLTDYEDAITDRTAAILHVHTSNFRVVGFTESVALQELSDLAHRRNVLLIDDNGSGALLDTSRFGIAHEPTPIEAIEAGVDAVAFSGDKLLGGPQAGIILGTSTILERVGRHPLARAVRPDKMTLAALHATLLAYIRGDAEVTLPIWRMIAAGVEDLERRVDRWRVATSQWGFGIELKPGESTVGGGSLPGETLPTVLAVLPPGVRGEHLRACATPIVGRTVRDRVVLDPRTVLETDEADLLDGLRALSHHPPGARKTVVDSAT